MKTVSMSGSPRANVGKKDAHSLRREALVPCVLYGGGSEQLHFSVPETAFKEVIFSPEVCYIEVSLNGKKHVTILQDIQYHKVTGRVLHADFFELMDTRKITLPIPVVYQGSSPGVLKGGKLIRTLRKLKVNAYPKDMPEGIVIDISKLDIGDYCKVQDLEAGKYSFFENPNTTICTVKTTRNVQADPAAPATTAAAPAAAAKTTATAKSAK
ncbi:50S ribosomal protein L25 [Bacteroidia bacterium]|nr:50S ribosomal protein L25 [Bacteroidia bacterium]